MTVTEPVEHPDTETLGVDEDEAVLHSVPVPEGLLLDDNEGVNDPDAEGQYEERAEAVKVTEGQFDALGVEEPDNVVVKVTLAHPVDERLEEGESVAVNEWVFETDGLEEKVDTPELVAEVQAVTLAD